ncbi:hypothetical protein [Bdellovibrio sp. HCB288]|uniref:hypothetical protein n=1 Tax=Bdellovibrio sp. HCB288 TaxID=3394355 RepID=UPI0039B48E3C
MPIQAGKFMLLALGLLGLLSFSSPAAHAAALCENVFNDVLEFDSRETFIEELNMKVNYRHIEFKKGEPKVADVLGNTDDILLGFAPFGHAYVVREATRLDGSVLTKAIVNDHMAELEAGIVVRIKRKHLNNEFLRKFDNSWGVTCSKVACAALAKADVFVGTNGTQFISPYAALTTILKKGLHDGSGNPIQFEIYNIGKFDMPVMLHRLKESSNRIQKDTMAKVGIIGTGITAVTGTILYLMHLDDEAEKALKNK